MRFKRHTLHSPIYGRDTHTQKLTLCECTIIVGTYEFTWAMINANTKENTIYFFTHCNKEKTRIKSFRFSWTWAHFAKIEPNTQNGEAFAFGSLNIWISIWLTWVILPTVTICTKSISTEFSIKCSISAF